MSFLNQVEDLIKTKNMEIFYVDGDKFPNSGTGYVYPVFCKKDIVSFVNSGRSGFLFQLIVHDNMTDKTI